MHAESGYRKEGRGGEYGWGGLTWIDAVWPESRFLPSTSLRARVTDKRTCDCDGLLRSGADGLGAELAAGGGDGDVAEALRAGLGGRRGGHFGVEFLQEILRGHDEEEVDDRGEDEEVDDGGEEVAVADLASVNVADQVAKVGLAYESSEKRVDDLFGERGDDCSEGGTDDDGHSQVHDVATQNEVAESLEHE